jgi:hypothetical protein
MDTVETSRRHHWSLTLLGIGLIIVFAYFGESVLSVLFFSILLSFVLDPLVELLGIHLRLPRSLARLQSFIHPAGRDASGIAGHQARRRFAWIYSSCENPLDAEAFRQQAEKFEKRRSGREPDTQM